MQPYNYTVHKEGRMNASIGHRHRYASGLRFVEYELKISKILHK